VTIRTTQAGANVRLREDQIVRTTQAGAFTRVGLVNLRSTQAGALSRLTLLRLRVTQVGTLLRLQAQEESPSSGKGINLSSASVGTVSGEADKSTASINSPKNKISAARSGGGGSSSGKIVQGLEFPSAGTEGDFHPERDFRVEFDDIQVEVSADCKIKVVNYSASAQSGEEYAELSVEVDNILSLLVLKKWLGKVLRIFNSNNQIVWVGVVTEVELGLNQYTLTGSLERMANRIAVIFEERSASGDKISRQTPFADHTESQQFFGFRKELLFSAGEATLEQAIVQRDQLLKDLAWPVGAPTIKKFFGAQVRCEGLMRSLAWTLYSNPFGRIGNSSRIKLQTLLGWRWTSQQVGFRKRKIFLFEDFIRSLKKGDRVRIVGTSKSFNEGTYELGNFSGEVLSQTSTQIYFDPADDLLHQDPEGWLGFEEEYFIKVEGSTNNSGFHWVKRKVDNSRMEISPGLSSNFVAEPPGAEITVRQSFTIDASREVEVELPGAEVTFFSHSEKIAQSFVSPVDMLLGRISLRLKKVNDGNDLVIKICQDNSGEPGTLLDTQLLFASEIPSFEREIWIELPVISISANVTYWIVIETPNVSSENYLLVGTSGELFFNTLGWDGASWSPLVKDGMNISLEFQLWDLEDTSVTMQRILAQCGQLLQGIDVASTGVRRCQYADGTLNAMEELLKVIKIGSSSGRLTVQVNPTNFKLLVKPEEPITNNLLILTEKGELKSPEGTILGEGVLPIGKWVEFEKSPQETNPNWKLSPFFVERAEYNRNSEPKLRLEPKFARNFRDRLREDRGGEADALKPFLR
jgi:hypothetical protein